MLGQAKPFAKIALGMKGENRGTWRSIRSDLESTEILESCEGFKSGIDRLAQISRLENGLVTDSIPRPVADKGAPPFRSDCASQNFSIIVTEKRSTRFGGIQGPVCVYGLVLNGSEAHFANARRLRFETHPDNC